MSPSRSALPLLRVNVAAAVEVGMVGVLHQDYQRTVDELEAVFDLRLAA